MATVEVARYDGLKERALAGWWVGQEHAEPELCPAPECDGKGTSAFDLYCDNGHFMLRADRLAAQRVVVNVIRTVVGLLVAITATTETSWPLYLIALSTGTAVVVLPLRGYRMARIVGSGGWLVAFVLVAAVREDVLAVEAAQTAGLVVVAALTAVVVLAIFLDPEHGTGDLVERAVAASGLGGMTVALLGVFLSTSLGERLLSAPSSLQTLLVYGGVLAAAGAVSAAAASGVVRGIASTNYDVRPLIRKPPRRPAPAIPHQIAPTRPESGSGLQVVFVVLVFAARIVQLVTNALNMVLRVVWGTAHLFLMTVVRVVNATTRFAVRVLRAVANAAKQIIRLLARSVKSAGKPILTWLRRALISVIALTTGAVLAVIASDLFAQYLISGGARNAAGSLGATALFPFALGTLWWALTPVSVGTVRTSIGEFLIDAGPYVFLTVLTIAWVLGIAGWLGIGQIRPGVLTYLGTAVVAVATVYAYATKPEPART